MKRVIFIIGIVILVISASLACATPTITTRTSVPAASAASTASTQPTAAPLTPKYGGVLRLVPRNSTKVFGYPGDMASSPAVDVSSPCLEALCGVNSRGEFLPTKLSTAYQVAPDGKSVTFTLRKGIKFHDGTDFNATAAKWNLEALKKARASGTDQWTTVDMIDDYTVRINVKTYQNTFIGQVANVSRISSLAAFDKYGVDKIHTFPVGTGPFKFVSYNPDVKIIWERNDDYWGGKPYLDGIETVFISDDMAKSAALQSGGVDMLFMVNPETAVALREKGYKVNAGGYEELVVMLPDSANADSPLNKLKVRQAIEYALDKKALSQLGNGFWTPIYQPSTPNSPGFVPNFEGRQYNPEKAKQLLTEAGYPNGFELKFIFAITPSVTPMDTMVAIQQYLSKVGITSDLQQMTGNQRSDYARSGWTNGYISQGLFCSLNYISALQFMIIPGGNMYVSTEKPAELAELLNAAASAADTKGAAQFAQKLNMTLYDYATILPLWVMPQQLDVQRPSIHDAGLYSTGAIFEWTPEKAWLDK